MEQLITAHELKKMYRRGSEEIFAVNGISLTINKGEYLSIIGPSGSGKTTLVNLLGCLDNPTSGELMIDSRQIFGNGKPLSERKLTRIRRELFGYIFQKFYLIPTLTVRENVILPCSFSKRKTTDEQLESLLTLLGLEKRAEHLPGQLSGGEMQRVAIARALINDPPLLLADEPTGNLDSARSSEIAEILKKLNQTKGLTIIMVTHNLALAQTAHRTIEIRDGKIHE